MAKPPQKAQKRGKAAPPPRPNSAKSKPAPAAKPAPKAAAKPAARPVAKAPAPAKPEPKGKRPAKAAPAPAPPPKKRNDLATKIVHLIAEEMAVEEAELTPTASFKEDLNLDEIDVAELLMRAEISFDVHPFSEEDWESCESVGDFVGLVEKRVEARRGKKAAKAPKAAKHKA